MGRSSLGPASRQVVSGRGVAPFLDVQGHRNAAGIPRYWLAGVVAERIRAMAVDNRTLSRVSEDKTTCN